jgi:hypothetical protein
MPQPGFLRAELFPRLRQNLEVKNGCFSTHFSNTFPSPASLGAEICFGLRLAWLTVLNQFSGGTRGRE